MKLHQFLKKTNIKKRYQYPIAYKHFLKINVLISLFVFFITFAPDII